MTALFSGLRSADVNVGQSSLQAVTACLASWNAPHQDQALCGRYVIRNDTTDAIRIGQSGTGESILIPSRRFHQYAWKVMADPGGSGASSEKRNRLQASTEAGRWRWCRPVSIDRVGTAVRLIAESKLPLIWSVRPVNSLQKEVTVRGQVQVANLIPQALEVKLLPEANKEGGLMEVRSAVPASSVPPSFVFPLDQLHGVKVRLAGHNVWSGLIPVSGNQRNVLLVRLAQKETPEEPLNIWCHLWTERIDQHHSRLLVRLSDHSVG